MATKMMSITATTDPFNVAFPEETPMASRILAVGDRSRAEAISSHFDGCSKDNIPECVITPNGMFTFTGTFNKVPVTIVGTGMGVAATDLIVRQARANVKGDLVIVRFGTCGTPNPEVPIGSFVVASGGSTMVLRNPNAFAAKAKGEVPTEPLYRFADVVPTSEPLSANLVKHLKQDHEGDERRPIFEGINATAEFFYCSQGRPARNFEDDNETLIDDMVAKYPTISSIEMETFHIADLARKAKEPTHISACCIVLAQRRADTFLSATDKHEMEHTGGVAILKAMTSFDPSQLKRSGDEKTGVVKKAKK